MATNILDVMKTIEQAMEPLPDELRRQVIRWAIKKYVSPTGETDAENIKQRNDEAEEKDASPTANQMDGSKTGIFYFDTKGGMVVNPRKYIDRIRHESDDKKK